MNKPILSKRKLDGLIALAAFVEAGSSDDVMGYPEDDLKGDMKRNWDDIQSACEWIRDMQTYKRIKKQEGEIAR